MANTYTQLYIQIVFAVKYRESLIDESIREQIQKYITGIVQKHGHKLLAIYCMPDHCHIFLSMTPKQSLSECVRTIKSNSSKWINQQRLVKKRFQWQEGFGAFSYSKSAVSNVANYVLNQKEHHQRKTFQKEYLQQLKKYEINYNEKYLFDWFY